MPMTNADYSALLPSDVANEVIGMVQEQSAVMRASKVIRMASGVVALPVASATPTARFVNSFGIKLGADQATDDKTARKPYGDIEWDVERAVAEEIAVVTSVPDAFLNDAGFDVWADVRARLATALAMEFDRVTLNGTNAPATYPTGGLAAVAQAAPDNPDDYAELMAAWAEVATRGGVVDGVVSSPMGQAGLYGMRTADGHPLYLQSLSDSAPTGIMGAPVYVARAWNIAAADMLVGDWSYSIVGIRQDITLDTSTDGVITDSAGLVRISAFQDDSTLVRCYMRVAYAIGKNNMGSGPEAPFALMKFGGTPVP